MLVTVKVNDLSSKHHSNGVLIVLDAQALARQAPYISGWACLLQARADQLGLLWTSPGYNRLRQRVCLAGA